MALVISLQDPTNGPFHIPLDKFCARAIFRKYFSEKLIKKVVF